MTTGETCVVNVKFAPMYPGIRRGDVLIVDGAGKVIAKTFIYGTAVGPQIGFNQGAVLTLPYPKMRQTPRSLVVNGAGDVFVGNFGTLVELPVGGGPPIAINPDKTPSPTIMTIDGGGDIFYTDGDSTDSFVEVPAGGGFIRKFYLDLFGNGTPTAISADNHGKVFLTTADDDPNFESTFFKYDPVTEKSTPLPLFGLDYVVGVAVDGSDDTILDNNGSLLKIPPAGSTPVVLPYPGTGCCYQPLVLDNVGNIFAFGYEDPESGGPAVRPWGNTDQTATQVQAVDAAGNLYAFDYFTVLELQRSKLDTFSFGSIPVGTTRTLPLEITNTGDQPLDFTPSFVSPTYHVLSESPENCEAGVNPIRTCTLMIEFAPLKVGEHSIQLTLKANGVADAVVLLRGTGTN